MCTIFLLFQKPSSNMQYMDRYNSVPEKQERKTQGKTQGKTSSYKAKKKHQSSGSDVDYVEYDNDNMSPLYSNWDQVSWLSSC